MNVSVIVFLMILFFLFFCVFPLVYRFHKEKCFRGNEHFEILIIPHVLTEDEVALHFFTEAVSLDITKVRGISWRGPNGVTSTIFSLPASITPTSIKIKFFDNFEKGDIISTTIILAV